MSFLKSSFRKILSSVLLFFFIVSGIFLAFPAKKADAYGAVVLDPVNLVQNTLSAIADTSNILKEGFAGIGLDGLAWVLAKQALRGITADTVKWINSGFEGNPAYVTNPEQLFTNVADNTFISVLGNSGGLFNKICTPFRLQLRNALVANYLQQNLYGQCTISGAIRDYTAFTQDFSQGGWEGWFSMTQNMQNNPYGAYLASKNELDISIANNTNRYQKQLDYGRGILSFESCSNSPSNFIGPLQPGEAPPSLEKCTTVTPGSVIADQLGNALGEGVKSLEAADEINEIIGALLTQAIKAVTGGIAGGLRGLSGDTQPGQSGSITSLLQTSSQTSNAPLDPNQPPPEQPPDINQIKADVAAQTTTFQSQYPNPTPCTIPGSNIIGTIDANGNCTQSSNSGGTTGGGTGTGTGAGGGGVGSNCITNGLQGTLDAQGTCLARSVSGGGGSSGPLPTNQISLVPDSMSKTITLPIATIPPLNSTYFTFSLNCPAVASPDSVVTYSITSNTFPGGQPTVAYIYGSASSSLGGSIACTAGTGKYTTNELLIRLPLDPALLPPGSYTLTLNGTSSDGTPVGQLILTLVFAAPATSATLSASLSASPSSTNPLIYMLTANTSGSTATGNSTYYFWRDCANNSNSVSTVSSACGALPPTPTTLGNCSNNNANGVVCLANASSQTANLGLPYSSGGTYTGKVIVERGTVTPAEARTTINVPSGIGATLTIPTTLPATNVTSNSATLNGSVSGATNWLFQWSTDSAFNTPNSSSRTSGSGNVSYSLTNLLPGTTYYFRLGNCDNALICMPSYGAPLSFPTPTTNSSNAFTVGQRVQTTANPNLNIRSTPSSAGTLLGTQALGSLGTIISGPTVASGSNWWNVNFDSGVDGYAVENYLVAYTSSGTSNQATLTLALTTPATTYLSAQNAGYSSASVSYQLTATCTRATNIIISATANTFWTILGGGLGWQTNTGSTAALPCNPGTPASTGASFGHSGTHPTGTFPVQFSVTNADGSGLVSTSGTIIVQ